ncbi:MAG: hypothetical protein MUD08_01350 [Cytophagales bacterium]|nr:hypothetical protein [Cytophagales bacterium]
MVRYFEKSTDEVVKSYEIGLYGNTVAVTEGTPAAEGESTTQAFENEAEALKAFEQKCAKKTNEGFVEKTYPFPFFGAGSAAYFEWAEVAVMFVQKPDDEQIRRIANAAPAPIKPGKKDFAGQMLLAGSEQFVNMHIQWAYGDDPDSDEYLDTDEDPCFYVTSEALNAFNKHIEDWLLEIHAFCPIVFAYRGEDGEAGGTQLSAWHRMSLDAVTGLLQNWAGDPSVYKQAKKAKELFEYCLKGVFYYGQVGLDAVPASFADAFFPDAKLRRLTDVADFTKRLDIAGIIHKAVKANEESLLAKIVETLSGQPNSCEHVYEIGSFANELGYRKKEFKHSRRMFDIALQIETPAPCSGANTTLTVYNNALWVLQHDNTGLPVDAALNERFLAKCLPYAPKNPAIFYNAACLYVEMEQFDKAVDCIRQAVAHKLNEMEEIKRQLNTEKMFADFRQYPPLAEVMKNL